uniref:Uncharacterized protein n=1 Tax=Mesocestoides corti TaxID=53468 RepID=A0A5K3G150_MESCO
MKYHFSDASVSGWLHTSLASNWLY